MFRPLFQLYTHYHPEEIFDQSIDQWWHWSLCISRTGISFILFMSFNANCWKTVILYLSLNSSIICLYYVRTWIEVRWSSEEPIVVATLNCMRTSKLSIRCIVTFYCVYDVIWIEVRWSSEKLIIEHHMRTSKLSIRSTTMNVRLKQRGSDRIDHSTLYADFEA